MTELQRAVTDELLIDHERTNDDIAVVLGIHTSSVSRIRYQMEQAGAIVKWRGLGNQIDAIRAELMASHERNNEDIAMAAGGGSINTVRRIRLSMEKEGAIPKWRGNFVDKDGVVKALLDDPKRPNDEIAERFSCGGSTVANVRYRLEKEGRITRWRGTAAGARKQSTYIIRGILTNRVKVGKTNDVARRFKHLQIGSPDLLEVVAVLEGEKWEHILHNELEPHHSHGEWFEGGDETDGIIAGVMTRYQQGDVL